MATLQLCKYAQNREIHPAGTSEKRTLIDQRIESLEASWRHAIPFNARTNVGTTAMAFDNSEDRFLLCGNSRGEVSIVDFESFTNRNATLETYPLNHKVMVAQKKSNHAFMINACQWYPVDTNIFVTAAMDKLLKIWDASRLTSVEDYKFSQPISDFHWAVSTGSSAASQIASATSSSNISLLDPRAGNTAQHIRARNQRIWSVRWLSSCNHRQNLLATGSDQGMIALWDIRSGKNELKSVKSPGGIEATNSKTAMLNINGKRHRDRDSTLAHRNRISCLRSSSDGRFMVSLSHDRNICLWDACSLKRLCWIKLPDSESDLSSTIPIRFELSSEGQSLWAFIPSGSEVIIVRLSPPIRTDGKQIYLEKEKEAHRCVRFLHGHFQNVISCVYRKTCQQLVTSSTDRLILIWSPRMDELRFDMAIQNIQHLHEDAFSDDEC